MTPTEWNTSNEKPSWKKLRFPTRLVFVKLPIVGGMIYDNLRIYDFLALFFYFTFVSFCNANNLGCHQKAKGHVEFYHLFHSLWYLLCCTSYNFVAFRKLRYFYFYGSVWRGVFITMSRPACVHCDIVNTFCDYIIEIKA